MAGLWYRVGTVTLTNGSKAVVGYGTKWKSANPLPGKGSMLCGPDGKVYEVDTVADDTNMTLVSNYTGTSGPGQGYALVLMALTIPQFSTQLSQFVQKNSLFASQINTLLTATGDVNLTDPDSGLVIKVPSWSKIASDGEGQAARAKVEADRSKTEADRSGTEADRAAGIVAAAALPLPDVWAPLSDSLRLITGYGRDVLVGSDVVARMVNFYRSGPATYWAKDDKLKSAAANEPRFEREGLLIEGQSTNLFPWSQEFIGKWIRVDGVASPDANFPNAVLLTDSAIGYVHTSVGNLNVGSPYAILAIVKGYVEGSTELKGIFANSGQDSSRVVGRYGPYTVLSFVRNAAVNTNPGVTGLTWAPGKATGIVLCALQIEALPFSSSYIPTTGAAATRTADKAWIQTAGNIAASPFTVAMEVNFRGVNSTSRYARLFTCGPACYAFFTDTNISGRFNSTSPVTAFSLNPIGRAVSGMVFNGATAKLFSAKKFGPASAISALTDADVSGDLILGSTTTLSSADTLFGHIRDVKIWRRTLTDDQIKAVA